MASAYRRSLEIAGEIGLQSVAFPAISTGVYGYPIEAAARVALQTILAFLQEHDRPALVRVVLFDRRAFETHRRVLQELLSA